MIQVDPVDMLLAVSMGGILSTALTTTYVGCLGRPLSPLEGWLVMISGAAATTLVAAVMLRMLS